MSEILSTEIEEIEKVLERYRATGKYTEEQLERIRKSLLDAKSKKTTSQSVPGIEPISGPTTQTDIDMSNVRKVIEESGEDISVDTDSKIYEDSNYVGESPGGDVGFALGTVEEDKDYLYETITREEQLEKQRKEEEEAIINIRNRVNKMNSDPLVNSYNSGSSFINPDNVDNFNLLTDTPGMQPYVAEEQDLMLDYNIRVDNARNSKSVFSDDFNDGQGNYTYNMNGISVTHNEQLNGAIDFNTFRNISVAQVNNVEKYISNQLNAFHNEYKNMRTNDVNEKGVDAAGFYYEFDWTPLDGDDVLKIHKYDYSDNKVETLKIDLPTVESEDFEGMWSKAYTDYVNFITQDNANAKKIAVDNVVFNWNDWVLDMKGSENLQDYLVKNKILSSDPSMKAREIDATNFVISDLLLMLDQDNQFIQIADTLTFITDDEKDADLDEKERLVNFHKHIGNIEFVKYDKMKKAKAIVADSGDSFLQQVKQVQ